MDLYIPKTPLQNQPGLGLVIQRMSAPEDKACIKRQF